LTRRQRGPGKKSYEKARRAYDIIRKEPGINQYLLASELGLKKLNNGAVESVLMSCVAHGMLVSEDRKGNLYAFEERGLYALRDWDGWI
jgi:DNA-binding PadR family transcriptional regulator